VTGVDAGVPCASRTGTDRRFKEGGTYAVWAGEKPLRKVDLLVGVLAPLTIRIGESEVHVGGAQSPLSCFECLPRLTRLWVLVRGA
jgi:hypothetical protein